MIWKTELFRTGSSAPSAGTKASNSRPGHTISSNMRTLSTPRCIPPPSPASFAYDNGYGNFDSEVANQMRLRGKLPANDRNAQQLAAFTSSTRAAPTAETYMVPSRKPPPCPPPSAHSLYSCPSSYQTPVSSSAAPIRPRSKVSSRKGTYLAQAQDRPARVSSLQRPAPTAGVWSVMSRRYAAPPVRSVLKTQTRTSEWECHYLQRGTLRQTPGVLAETMAKQRKRWWGGKKEAEADQHGDVAVGETSGWY